MGQTKARVRRLLMEAFAGEPTPSGFSGRGVKSREFLDGVREDLITLIPDQFHFLVPRVLLDLLDHHTGEIANGAEDVVGSLCRYWSGAPVDMSDVTPEAPAAGRSTAPRKPERDEQVSALLRMFTTEQAYAIRQWLIYARPWPEFDIYRHWVDEAIAIWSRGAGLAPPTDQELRAGAGRRIWPRRIPLEEAAAAGNLEEVRTLLQSGQDVNRQDRGRSSALESAVTVGSTAIVRLLLEAGANPNIRNWDRATPLYSAAHMGNVEIAALLLFYGADVDALRPSVSAPQAACLFFRKPADLEAEQVKTVAGLLRKSKECQIAHRLTQSFASMVRDRRAERLLPWLREARASDLPELRRFAQGLESDLNAVRAGIVGDWSNGTTEGAINRLKFLKRQMYGRASFHLLRQRVLHPDSKRREAPHKVTKNHFITGVDMSCSWRPAPLWERWRTQRPVESPRRTFKRGFGEGSCPPSAAIFRRPRWHKAIERQPVEAIRFFGEGLLGDEAGGAYPPAIGRAMRYRVREMAGDRRELGRVRFRAGASDRHCGGRLRGTSRAD